MATDPFGNYAQHDYWSQASSPSNQSGQAQASILSTIKEANDESPDTILGATAVISGQANVLLDPYQMTPRDGRKSPEDQRESRELNWMPSEPYTLVHGVVTPIEPTRSAGGWACTC